MNTADVVEGSHNDYGIEHQSNPPREDNRDHLIYNYCNIGVVLFVELRGRAINIKINIQFRFFFGGSDLRRFRL